MKPSSGKGGGKVLLFIKATAGNQGQNKAAVDRSPCSTDGSPSTALEAGFR